MLPCFVSRALLYVSKFSFIPRSAFYKIVLGYAYPAFECFKIVEHNNQEPNELLFWNQYWILVAALTAMERVGDTFISWLPMYCEAKVALVVYLWYSKTRGAVFVYKKYLSPLVAKHENEIDYYLLVLKNKFMSNAVLVSQKVRNYGMERFFEILQYVSSQSALKPKSKALKTPS